MIYMKKTTKDWLTKINDLSKQRNKHEYENSRLLRRQFFPN